VPTTAIVNGGSWLSLLIFLQKRLNCNADKTGSAAPALLILTRASPLPAFATLPQCAHATAERWPLRPPQTIAKTVVHNFRVLNIKK
tara:strand:- start:1754 stop:2014 length:261 start_codon:yes stop_codon:yes gene_type:complete